MKFNIRVVNPTPTKRYTVASTVVEFEPGQFKPEDWALEQVEPFGQPHQDGTVRHARVRFPVWLEANEEREEVLPRMPRAQALKSGLGKAKAAPFQFHRNINPPRLLATTFGLRENGTELNLLHDITPVDDACGAMVQQYRSTNRLTGSTLWAELTLELHTDAPYIRWWLLSSSSAADLHVDGCTLAVHGEAGVLTGALLFGGLGLSSEDAGTLEAEAIAPTVAGEHENAGGWPELWGATT